MRNYFSGTLAECRTLNTELDERYGLPNQETMTNTYAVPQKHPRRDEWFLIIKPVHNQQKRKIENPEIYLKTADRATLKTLEQVKADGFFPKPERRTLEV